MDIRPGRILLFREVDRQLGGVEKRLLGRVGSALCTQYDMTPRRPIQVKEKVIAPGQAGAQMIVARVMPPHPDFKSVAAEIAPG